MVDVKPRDETFKIFLNNVDSFKGKYILSYLYKQGFEVAERDHQESKKFDFDFNKEDEPVEDLKPVKSESARRDVEEGKDKVVIDARLSVTAKPTVAQLTSLNSKYKIFGTLMDYKKFKEDASYEMVGETHEQFKKVIRMCDCVIYDITLDEAQIPKALMALDFIEKKCDRQEETCTKHIAPVTFILISTVMTWALTPSMDPIDPDPVPFNESDYRRRKPHPNFKEHYACEKEVLQRGKKMKNKIRTFVVCSAVAYGYEENILSFFFKRAWNNDKYLPVFGKGTNFVPLIHVTDLSKVICKIVDTPSLKNQYMIAVEQTPTPLRFIVKYISRTMGSGKIEYINAEEAFLYPEMDQYVFDHLTASIVLEPVFIIEKLHIDWKSEMNLVENIEEIVEEFKVRRNLQPLKIFVQGAPCTGKSTLSRLLSEHYNLSIISLNKIMSEHDEYVIYLKQKLSNKERPQSPSTLNAENLKGDRDAEYFLGLMVDDSEEENYQKTASETRKKLLLEYLMNSSSERMSDERIVRLIRNEMLSNESQNQGFVLDGFPRAFRQLFKNDRMRYLDHDDRPSSVFRNHEKLMPNYVIVLDSSDEFLLERISRTPEKEVQCTNYDDRDVIRRLMFYREHNTTDWNPSLYFKDCDTDVIEIDISEFPSQNMDCIFYICKKILGPPRGFGLSTKECEDLEIAKKQAEKLRLEKGELEKKLQEKKKQEELEAKMEVMLKTYHEENIRTERKFAPIIDKYRQFIATKILPILTEAVIILAQKQPEDPIDFLAEYLFKNNPHGKMYNPKYTRDGEKLINENIY
ncbi:hypothetical protein WA026_013405 [Henosepilachna vigintioctopunctata]|uniref:Adenylate kinase 7 n=1 Tax=Henosepilachna vigintioctopunctata TaxID=420089 RepID=A0AAW1VE21_9CUCU